MPERLYQEFETLFMKHHKELIGLSYNIVRDQDFDILSDTRSVVVKVKSAQTTTHKSY